MIKTFARAVTNLHRDNRGLTLTEAAIVCGVFAVLVAACLYVLVGAGLSSAETGKKTVYAGIETMKSGIGLSGSVIAKSLDATTARYIFFTVENAADGRPVELTPCGGTANAATTCVINLITKDTHLNNIKWSKMAIGVDDGDTLLEAGEQFEITIDTENLGDGKSLRQPLQANDTFTIQLELLSGYRVTITRTLPCVLDAIMDLR